MPLKNGTQKLKVLGPDFRRDDGKKRYWVPTFVVMTIRGCDYGKICDDDKVKGCDDDDR
jgi:hypothetical protein